MKINQLTNKQQMSTASVEILRASEEQLLTTQQIVMAEPVPELPLKIVRFIFRNFGSIAPKILGKLAFKLFTTPRNRQFQQKRTAHPILQKAEKFYIPHQYKGVDDQLEGFLWGSADQPTVLMVHGWETGAWVFRRFVQVLQNQGFSVAAFNAPAHAYSSSKQTEIMDYGTAIYNTIQQLGNVTALVGHSFGADSSTFMLADKPKIPNLKTFVSIGSPSSIVNVVARMADFLELPPKAVAAFNKVLLEKAGKPVEELSIATAGRDLKVDNVMIVHDRYDEVVPFSDAEEIAKEWTQAHFLITEGYGHNAILKSPEVIQRVTQFLLQ